MRICTVFIALVCLFTFAPAGAVVDLRTGEFSDTWVDLVDPGVALNLIVRRTFRSHFRGGGSFGHGWCSYLDESVVERNGRPAVVTCSGQPGPSYLSSPKSMSRFIAWNGTNDLIDRNSVGWTRRTADGSIRHYDEKGRLTAIRAKGGDETLLQRNVNGQVISVWDGHRSRKLEISRDSEGHIVAVEGPGQRSAKYTYENGYLTKVVNAWSNAYVYRYTRGLLSAIEYTDGKADRIEYGRNGELIALHSRFGCTESYQKTTGKVSQFTVTATCPGQPDRHRNFEISNISNNNFLSSRMPASVATDDKNPIQVKLKSDLFGRPTLISAAKNAKAWQLKIHYRENSPFPSAYEVPGLGVVKIDFHADGSVRAIQDNLPIESRTKIMSIVAEAAQSLGRNEGR